MEFGIEKYAMPVMKSGKRHMTEGVELPNQVVIRTLGEKETYKYLGILKADTIKQERTLTDYMCKEEREEENLAALKTALTHQYNYIKKRAGRLITSTRNNTNDMRTSGTTIPRKQK